MGGGCAISSTINHFCSSKNGRQVRQNAQALHASLSRHQAAEQQLFGGCRKSRKAVASPSASTAGAYDSSLMQNCWRRRGKGRASSAMWHWFPADMDIEALLHKSAASVCARENQKCGGAFFFAQLAVRRRTALSLGKFTLSARASQADTLLCL